MLNFADWKNLMVKQANNRRSNLRDLPAYSAVEVAHYLNLPRSTVRYWATGKDSSPALVEVADTDPLAFSFHNLVELHVLAAIRRRHIEAALRRIERDRHGIPVKLYPFTRSNINNAPAMVVIDPALSAGRPVITGTGLATEVIAERYKAGETVAELAKDYDRKEAEIEEAIRCELKIAA